MEDKIDAPIKCYEDKIHATIKCYMHEKKNQESSQLDMGSASMPPCSSQQQPPLHYAHHAADPIAAPSQHRSVKQLLTRSPHDTDLEEG